MTVTAAPRPLVIGSVVLDRIHSAAGGEAGQVEERVGGAALNVATGLSRLGHPVDLVGAIADDPAGRAVRGFAGSEGIRLLGDAGRGRPTAVVASERSAGSVVYRFQGTVPSGLLHLDDAQLASIRSAPAVAISAARFPDGEARHRVAEALRAGPRIRVYDPNPRRRGEADLDRHRQEIATLRGACTVVKLAVEDVELLYDAPVETVTAEFLDAGAEAVLVTHGARGASLSTRHGMAKTASRIRAAEVVDPMGAGDATVAALVCGLIEHGWPDGLAGWRELLDGCMRVAAMTCRQRGASTAMPHRAELRAPDDDAPRRPPRAGAG